MRRNLQKRAAKLVTCINGIWECDDGVEKRSVAHHGKFPQQYRPIANSYKGTAERKCEPARKHYKKSLFS